MKRFVLNLASLLVIAAGGIYLASPASAGQLSTQATCGDCEGECCGFDDNGRCWASDKCDPVKPAG